MFKRHKDTIEEDKKVKEEIETEVEGKRLLKEKEWLLYERLGTYDFLAFLVNHKEITNPIIHNFFRLGMIEYVEKVKRDLLNDPNYKKDLKMNEK